MKALTLSLGLLAATPLIYDCGVGKLDLPCRRVAAPSWKVAPLDSRHADKAYVVKFGESGSKADEPGWVVSFGNAARQALFWAAVVTTFIL